MPSRVTERIARRFASRFSRQPYALRTVGREAEYPVVWPDGNAADVRLLLAELQNFDDGFQYTHEELPSFFQGPQKCLTGIRSKDSKLEIILEVGWGTVEVVTGPFDDLMQVKHAHEHAMTLLTQAADKLGMKVLSTGVQPRTPPGLELMTPRERYLTMRKVLGPNVWDNWCATSADQVHVAVCFDEIADITNLVNCLHSVVIALCGNSHFMSGKPTPYHCSRQGLMHTLGSRHGMPSKPFDSVEEHLEAIMDEQYLWTKNDATGMIDVVNDRTFSSWAESKLMAEDGSSAMNNSKNKSIYSDIQITGEMSPDYEYEAFLLHDHYVWHSARPRSKQGTVECRAACQQPWNEHMSAAALNLGIVEGYREIWELVLSKFGSRQAAWDAMDAATPYAERYGLKSSDIAGLEADFLLDILGACERALEGRGRGEEILMKPLYQRLERGENPAALAASVANEGGMAGFLEHSEVRID